MHSTNSLDLVYLFCWYFKFTKTHCVNMEVSGVAPSSVSSMPFLSVYQNSKQMIDKSSHISLCITNINGFWLSSYQVLHQRTTIIIIQTDWSIVLVVPVVGFDCMQLSLLNVLSTLHHGTGVNIVCLSKSCNAMETAQIFWEINRWVHKLMLLDWVCPFFLRQLCFFLQSHGHVQYTIKKQLL